MLTSYNKKMENASLTDSPRVVAKRDWWTK